MRFDTFRLTSITLRLQSKHRSSINVSKYRDSPQAHVIEFWRQATVLSSQFYHFYPFSKIMAPPRKATKRSAENDIDKPSKKRVATKKNVAEFVVNPNFRKSEPGVALVFGQGDVGQLGLGENVMEKSRPAKLPNYENIISVAAGGMHSVILTSTGKIMTFGCNDEGALGRDTSEENSEMIPAETNLPGKVVQITAGDSHSAALLEDGRVFAWGSFRDAHGNMGLNSSGNARTPLEMLPSQKVVKISSGADHLVMLTNKGQIYTCGCAEQGQLGRISQRSADRSCRYGIDMLLVPALVVLKKNKLFKDVWAGSYCTFAKDTEGEIYAFGLNNYYQMGLKDDTTHFYPQISKTFSGKKWTHISSGQHHTLALEEDGGVYVLGRKEYGRLGLGTDCTDATSLVKVPALSDKKCIDIGTGSAQSFAVTESGELFSWGMGTNGQLGTGEEKDVETPVLISGKQLQQKKVQRVSGGGQHTIILAVDAQSS